MADLCTDSMDRSTKVKQRCITVAPLGYPLSFPALFQTSHLQFQVGLMAQMRLEREQHSALDLPLPEFYGEEQTAV